MKWFGDNWGAPINATTEQVKTPEGLECAHGCGHSIRYGDQGLLIPLMSPLSTEDVSSVLRNGTIEIDGLQYVAYHLVCFFDTIGVRGRTHN